MSTQTIPSTPVIVEKPVEQPAQTAEVKELAKTVTEKLLSTTSEDGKVLFTLRYKKNQVTQTANFWFPDDQKAAENAARSYCQRFRLRFIWVEKFAIDINAKPKEGED